VTLSCSIKVLLPVYLGSHLYDTRHTSLDTGLAQAGDNHRSTLLRRSSEHREELCNPALGPIRLFNQVYRYTPPSKQCREHPEVGSYFDADTYTVSVCEEAAGDCCADGESEEEGCEDNVTGGCCDCLLCMKSTSADEDNEDKKGGTYTNPGKRSQHHKPRRQFRKMSMNVACRQCASRIQQEHQPLTHPERTPPIHLSVLSSFSHLLCSTHPLT